MGLKIARKRVQRWYKLDLSANVYPTLQRRNFSSVYRISAYMTEKVNPELLQKALDMVMPRFPLFASAIHKGFFWRYLDSNTKPGPFVRPDVSNACMPMRFKAENRYLIRVFYYENKISFEAFHSLADGSGALTFMKTLLAQYLRLSGHCIPCSDGVLDLSDKPSPEETEDAYLKCGKTKFALKRGGTEAYCIRGTMEPFYTLNIISGIIDVDKALQVAKSYKVSLGEYLTAVLIDALIRKQKMEKPFREKEVAISVPVNLRRFFPSTTLRNFIVMVKPSVNPRMGDYTFEEIAKEVHNYMAYRVNEKYLRASIMTNLTTQQHPVVRVIPLFIKDIIVRNAYRRVSDKQSSAGMTNLGIITVPEKMKPYIDRFEILMGQPFSNRSNVAIATYEKKLVIAFTSGIVETDVEMMFFRKLVQDGIHVKIESNRSFRLK